MRALNFLAAGGLNFGPLCRPRICSSSKVPMNLKWTWKIREGQQKSLTMCYLSGKLEALKLESRSCRSALRTDLEGCEGPAVCARIGAAPISPSEKPYRPLPLPCECQKLGPGTSCLDASLAGALALHCSIEQGRAEGMDQLGRESTSTLLVLLQSATGSKGTTRLSNSVGIDREVDRNTQWQLPMQSEPSRLMLLTSWSHLLDRDRDTSKLPVAMAAKLRAKPCE